MNSHLLGLSHIEISGADAASWLQNLVTADLENQQNGTAIGAALLTPQGKILFDFLVLKKESQIFQLECKTELAHGLAQRLAVYKMRAKLEIQPAVSVCVDINDHSGTWRDMRFGTPVWRSLVDRAEKSRDEFDLLRIAYGVAESGTDYLSGDAFPHDVNLDQIGGVGFRKGCYVGQEVVSRMQHRGTARKRLVIVKSDGALPESGTPILVGERDIGTLGTVVGNIGLAIIRLDKAAEAEFPIMAANAELSLELPLGATFSLSPEINHG